MSKVTPLKVAVPEDSVAVMVAFPLFEKVDWGDPPATPSWMKSDELLATLPFESLAVAVTENPVPTVWGEAMVPMDSEATVELAVMVTLLAAVA